ncbi:LPXTG cell wall anchor domain-containing protein [Allorhizocola rhizosphaerae]|uniref:LPXTG cell wall anchor domain-containing protein n=1 Tax=Allorhizocola rhizosphaerae TaxID=1872709 RepID=UPI0013C2E122|nr:LPXTG cell wall anchor domain-containing protein [Allorhizocola rhizosphaerae]
MRKALSAVGAAVVLMVMGLAVPAAAQPTDTPTITFREKCNAVVVQVRMESKQRYTFKVGKKDGHQSIIVIEGDSDYPVEVEQGETVEATLTHGLQVVVVQAEHVRQTPVTCKTPYVDLSRHPQCQDDSMIVELKNRNGQTSGFTLFRNDELIVKDVALPTYERRFFVLNGLSADDKIHVKYGPDLDPFGTLVRAPAQHCEHVSAVRFTDSCEGVRIGISPAKASMYAHVYDFRNYYREFETHGDMTSVPAEPGQLVAVFDLIDPGSEQRPEIIAEVAAHVHARPANCSGGGGGGALPVTGRRTPLLVWAGAVLLAAGIVALWFGRRRPYQA